jgi:hypothetical protein
VPGGTLLAVSRREEFGLNRTADAFRHAKGHGAHALCLDILQAIPNISREAHRRTMTLPR